MKNFELMNLLSKQPAGAEVGILVEAANGWVTCDVGSVETLDDNGNGFLQIQGKTGNDFETEDEEE